MKANRKPLKTGPDTATTAPVTEILGRVAAELRQAAVLIERLPICTEHFKESMGSEDSHYLRAMQGLDHSSQRLSGLADFLSALADRAPAHWHLDTHLASQVVTLAELAKRLKLTAEAAGESAGASSGDCEFF
jgi:hypothetical protein